MAFYDNLEKYAMNEALIENTGKRVTYAQLDCLTNEIGNQMETRKLIFIFCTNTIGSVAGYVASLKYKVVPLLLKADMEKGLRINLLQIYQPSYVYIPVNMKEEFVDACLLWEKLGYCLMKTNYVQEITLHPDLGLLLTTSGSTGSPKLVRQSYINIQANAESIASYLEITEKDRPITTLSMNYTYGLSIINSHLLSGAAILLTDNTLMERSFWDFFKKEDASSFGSVPYTYEMLKKLNFFKMDLKSLQTMTQAGGKLSPELHREFADFARKQNKRFVVMYGQTEATARMGYLPWDKATEKYGSMGIAIPGGELWLQDSEGNKICKPQITGELVYKGDNVTMGYAECITDLAKGDERHGILNTGDMAVMDQDGYFYIVGRKKRFLKIFGNRVNLDEAEQMLKIQYPDYECACTGTDDKLYIFTTCTMAEVQLQMKHFLSNKMKLHISAFIVKYLEVIPKNESGKVAYRSLKEFL